MEKVYPILGKIFLVVLVLGSVGLGGAYLNQIGILNTNILNSQSPTPQPRNNTETAANNSYKIESLTTPAPVLEFKTIEAGLDKSSGLSFTKYSVQIPTDWIYNHEYENPGVPTDTLTLTKGEYSIKIFQAATGGAVCLYPGDPGFEGPNSKYDVFVNLTTKDGTNLRRSGTNAYQGNTRGFTVCQKDSEGGYQQPSGYGHIQITTPVNISNPVIEEVDNILKSLFKTS